ncbi:MAG: hypothetical protein AAB425_11175, partial [Bdellovibrionota bacterium]
RLGRGDWRYMLGIKKFYERSICLDAQGSGTRLAHFGFVTAALIFLFLLTLAHLTPGGNQAQAGVFTTPHFFEPTNFSLGLEPEVTFGGKFGLGIQARYTHGVSEINNFGVILGTGSGSRNFRAGVNLTFDIFPDTSGQPGIGVAIQGMYYRTKEASGLFEASGIPYIHKTFEGKTSEFEPYLAIPTGLALSGGMYEPLVQLAIGTFFSQRKSPLRYAAEVGIALMNSQTYFSGGLVYQFD